MIYKYSRLIWWLDIFFRQILTSPEIYNQVTPFNHVQGILIVVFKGRKGFTGLLNHPVNTHDVRFLSHHVRLR